MKPLQIENVSIKYGETLILNFSLFPLFPKMCYFKVLPRSRSGKEKKDIKHFFVESCQSLKKKNWENYYFIVKTQ